MPARGTQLCPWRYETRIRGVSC